MPARRWLKRTIPLELVSSLPKGPMLSSFAQMEIKFQAQRYWVD